MDEMQEILGDFLVESFELIEQLDQDLIELEHHPEDLDLINRIFRVAHTIKGSSSFLGLETLTHLTHNMEDVLNKTRKGDLLITPAIMDVILESTNKMRTLLEDIRDGGANQGKDQVESIVQKLQRISNGDSLQTPQEIEEQKAQEIEDYSHLSGDEVEAEIERLLKERQELDRQKRKTKKASTKSQTPPIQPTTPNPQPSSPQPTTKPTTPAKTNEQSVRVDVKRLDHLMNLIGELVLGRNRLLKIHADIDDSHSHNALSDELNQVITSISTVTTDLQLAVMKTRMLPIIKVFNKFPRMIRDLAKELDKKIELVMSGEETELDKSIIEEIGDPLVHMIRNSCDHGIETPKERVQKGKNEIGTINLKAYNEGNHIVIEIQDDGKGLNPQALKEKAIEKQLISEQEAQGMSDKEAYSLIFRAGFSTAASITNISGRGVGMDVVKSNIEKLNGIIDIESTLNQGTTLKLKIPLTLAIIQVLIAKIDQDCYAIPLSSVLETVKISQEEISTADGRSVWFRDEILPLVRMSDIFQINQNPQDYKDFSVIIVGFSDQKIGIIVDALIGQEEVVVKSLGDYLGDIQGIAGATIRGDGKIALILDVASLFDIAKSIKINLNQQTPNHALLESLKILIVDSDTDYHRIIKHSFKDLKISQVNSTQEAIKALNEGYFDGILAHSKLIKDSLIQSAREIPIVAFVNTGEKLNERLQAQVATYTTKPYTREALLELMIKNFHKGR